MMVGVSIRNVPKPKWMDIEEGDCEAGYLRDMGQKVVAELNGHGLRAEAKAERDDVSGEMVKDTRLIEVNGISNMLRECKFEIKLGMNPKAYSYDHKNPLSPFLYDMERRLEPFTAKVTGEMNSDLAQKIVTIINKVFVQDHAAVIVTCLRQHTD